MSSNKSRIYILIAAALILAVGFAAVRAILVVNYYDVEEGLYASDATGITAVRILFGASLLLLGVLSFLLVKKREFKQMPEANHGVVFTGAMCGFMFISSAILVSYYFLPSHFKTVFGSNHGGIDIVLLIMLLLTVLFGLASSLYYFWCAATTTKLKKLPYRLFSLMPVMFFIFYLVFMYFKKDTVMNSPERTITQLSAIAVMVYCVAEARFHFGIARYRTYTAVSLIAVTSVIVACVPGFLLTAFWVMPFTTETVYEVLQLAMAAYIIFRLISTATAETEKEETEEN
ncbi:MAG: hypothetical protein IJT49_09255 [Clostridia bacterium]|nr:hypothetical protein [Clostridia bacterium]